jgi:hypothetical protein
VGAGSKHDNELTFEYDASINGLKGIHGHHGSAWQGDFCGGDCVKENHTNHCSHSSHCNCSISRWIKQY